MPFPESARIELVWTPLLPAAALPERPLVFVHLLDSEDRLVRTFDHELDLTDWEVGRTLTRPLELHQNYLAPHLEAASYRLTAGLYDPVLGRFALDTRDDSDSDLEYVLATVLVPAERSGVNIAFGGDWLPIESAGEQQVVASRWMGASGRLELAPVEVPLVLRLQIKIPEEIERSTIHASRRSAIGESAVDPTAPAGDDPAPLLGITSDCGPGFETDEIGTHRVALRLEPPLPGESPTPTCTVSLRGGRLWVDDRGLERTVSLEVATLTPDAATAPL